MMDTGGATPVGSPSATPPPLCIQEQPSSTTNVSLKSILALFFQLFFYLFLLFSD